MGHLLKVRMSLYLMSSNSGLLFLPLQCKRRADSERGTINGLLSLEE